MSRRLRLAGLVLAPNQPRVSCRAAALPSGLACRELFIDFARIDALRRARGPSLSSAVDAWPLKREFIH